MDSQSDGSNRVKFYCGATVEYMPLESRRQASLLLYILVKTSSSKRVMTWPLCKFDGYSTTTLILPGTTLHIALGDAHIKSPSLLPGPHKQRINLHRTRIMTLDMMSLPHVL